MKTLKVFLPATFIFISICSYAGETGPCSADGPRLCPGVPFKQGKMFECLKEKRSKLSEKCGKHIDEMIAYREICRNDIIKYCTGGRPFYCLWDPEFKHVVLEPKCKKAVSE
jgi:hypothetical protein